jgi:hypothetical protein
MTRDSVNAELQRLAGGLRPDEDGVARFLERISLREDSADLRSALSYIGAQALLERLQTARTEGIRRACEKHMERHGA